MTLQNHAAVTPGQAQMTFFISEYTFEFFICLSLTPLPLLSPSVQLREVPGPEKAAVQPNPLVKRTTFTGRTRELDGRIEFNAKFEHNLFP